MPRTFIAQSRFRVARVYGVTAQVLASYIWLRFQRPFVPEARYSARVARAHTRNARRVERAIVAAGGLFIKVGQMISILSNFLPEEFRRELEGLQDQLPPRPYEEIAARIQSEFGRSPEELFASFDRTPIATASLAQVHLATLADGRVVAVKSQHAEIERVAQLDLELIRRLLRIIQFVTGVRGMESYHPEIRQMVAEELDFRSEARNTERIAAQFEGDPHVRFPVVVPERSGMHVLTTEYIRGTKITDFAALAERVLDRRILAERILTAYCRMIFVDGVYHADPHPGNILVAQDGAIAFVDFGAIGVLSPTMKSGIAEFFHGMLARDPARVAAAMGAMGFIAREARAEDVANRVVNYAQTRFFDQLTGDAWNLGEIQVDMRSRLEVLSDLRKLDVSFRELTATFQVPRDWVLLERTLILLVGLCTALDPTWNPMTVIRPYLENVVLGEDRDWTAVIGESVKDMALRAATLPESLQQVLGRVNRGDLEVRVPEISAAARLLYAAAHQLIYCILGVASAVLAYQALDRGHFGLAVWLGVAAAAFVVALFMSMAGAARHRKP